MLEDAKTLPATFPTSLGDNSVKEPEEERESKGKRNGVVSSPISTGRVAGEGFPLVLAMMYRN